jgi:hypothetical protein
MEYPMGYTSQWSPLFCLARQQLGFILVYYPYSRHKSHEDAAAAPRDLTNARVTRRIFGDATSKELDNPAFIDDYNHHMNGVDLANQFRGTYETHGTGRRNWLPMFYWFLDIAIVNAFRIQYLHAKTDW